MAEGGPGRAAQVTSQRSGSSTGRRVVSAVLAAVLLAVGFVALGPADRADAGPAPVMTGYVPMPAADYQALFESINTAADSTLDYQVGITNAGDGAVMYYDHWEDGYEADIANPVQATTEIWGDGNTANGDAGAAGRCGVRCSGDLLTPGDVFTLRNNIAIPRVAAQVRFDGRDKVAATRGFSVSVITWTTPLGSVLAGSVAAYDTTKWGTSFVFPVGQNTPFPAGENDPFEFAGASIMAASANTQVQIDADGNGTFETTATIGEGETYLVNGGVNQGGRVVSSKPVQVHMVTGDVGDTYESRSYIVLPLSLLSGSYSRAATSVRWAPASSTTRRSSTSTTRTARRSRSPRPARARAAGRRSTCRPTTGPSSRSRSARGSVWSPPGASGSRSSARTARAAVSPQASPTTVPTGTGASPSSRPAS